MKLILNIIFFLIPEQSTFRITDQFQRLYKVHHHIKLIKYLRCPDFFFVYYKFTSFQFPKSISLCRLKHKAVCYRDI